MADLILFPELALSGYPPEDRLLRPGFLHRCHDVMDELIQHVHGIDVLIGHPWAEDAGRFNAVSWIPGPASIAKTAGAELLLIPDWLWATALFMVICVAVFHRLKTD